MKLTACGAQDERREPRGVADVAGAGLARNCAHDAGPDNAQLAVMCQLGVQQHALCQALGQEVGVCQAIAAHDVGSLRCMVSGAQLYACQWVLSLRGVQSLHLFKAGTLRAYVA